jgi:hypothetical protein
MVVNSGLHADDRAFPVDGQQSAMSLPPAAASGAGGDGDGDDASGASNLSLPPPPAPF